jgi:hypothetical protein
MGVRFGLGVDGWWHSRAWWRVEREWSLEWERGSRMVGRGGVGDLVVVVVVRGVVLFLPSVSLGLS